MNRLMGIAPLFGGLGVVLAILSLATPLPAGAIGAFGLIAWTIWSKIHWSQDLEEHVLPDEPERALRIELSGYALLLGHFVMSMVLVGADLRLGNGNTLAIDSWIMMVAAFGASILFRKERRVQDERDRLIAASGIKISFYTLIITNTLFSFYIAFVPPTSELHLPNFLVANMIIALCLFSYLVQICVRLLSYENERRSETSGLT